MGGEVLQTGELLCFPLLLFPAKTRLEAFRRGMLLRFIEPRSGGGAHCVMLALGCHIRAHAKLMVDETMHAATEECAMVQSSLRDLTGFWDD